MNSPRSSIHVQVLFSYQGVTYSPSVIIELDTYLENNAPIPAFDRLLAQHNDIDTYSYQYEVMQQAEVQYIGAQGLAQEFCRNGEFDLAGFEQKWHENRVLNRLSEIAQEHLAVTDLDENEALKKALLSAYQLGRQ